MKYLISIYMWTVGGLYVGFVMIGLGLLSYIISERKLDPLLKRMLKLLFRLLFIKVRVEGKERLENIKTAIFMCNHVSIFDNLLLGAYIPSYFRGIEADRQFKWFLYGWFVKRLKNIPINRESVHESIQSMRKAAERLKQGTSIAIMPEGHRTRDGKIGTFKKLPFFLAKEADVPIVPIGISGLFHLKPKKGWLIRPTPLKIKFGTSISLSEIRKKTAIELRDYTHDRIKSLIERP